MRQLLSVAILVMLVGQSSVQAEVPSLIRYQGQAVDTNSVPLEGPYTLKFRLYGAATGGTVVWEETQLNVPLAKGNFSVLLGSVTPLNGMDWAQPCWLSVQVNSEPELAPRQQITSVPLALRAKTAEVVKTSGITDDSNRLVPSGAIILWNSGSCPVGYTRLAALDGATLKVGAVASNPTPATVPDLPAHSHSMTGTTSVNGSHKHRLHVEFDSGGETGLYTTTLNQPIPDGTTYEDAAGDHSHSVTGSTNTVGTATVATVLLCQKD